MASISTESRAKGEGRCRFFYSQKMQKWKSWGKNHKNIRDDLDLFLFADFRRILPMVNQQEFHPHLGNIFSQPPNKQSLVYSLVNDHIAIAGIYQFSIGFIHLNRWSIFQLLCQITGV